jgi:hypothetical protein
MACFMVNCRLGSPGDDYVGLAQAIEQLGRAWECPGSTWIVASELGAGEIRDALRPHLGRFDELLVAELSGAVAWRGASSGLSNGLRAVLG